MRKPSTQFWAHPAADGLSMWVVGPQGQLLDATKLGLVARQFSDGGEEGTLPRSAIPDGPLSAFVSSDILLPTSIGTSPLMIEAGNYAVSSVGACLLSPEASDGTRLLSLMPPQRLSDLNRSRAGAFDGYNDPEMKAEQDPDFAVVHGRPGTVDVPLREVRFDYMRRVLAAAPTYVPFRFTAPPSPWTGTGRRGGFENLNQCAEVRSNSLPENVNLLSGVEVIEWESMNRVEGFQQQGFSRTPRFTITAILLVTPQEKEVLSKLRDKVELASVVDDTPRTSLDPEVVHLLEGSPEADEKPASHRE